MPVLRHAWKSPWKKKLVSAGSAPQPWRGCCESSSTTRRDTAGSKLGVQGHGCDPLRAAKISWPCQGAQTEADQSINPTFPSLELGLSWQSRPLPALRGHEPAVSTRAGGQVSLPWPVGMALGWESRDHAARGGDQPVQTPSPRLHEGDAPSPRGQKCPSLPETLADTETAFQLYPPTTCL